MPRGLRQKAKDGRLGISIKNVVLPPQVMLLALLLTIGLIITLGILEIVRVEASGRAERGEV